MEEIEFLIAVVVALLSVGGQPVSLFLGLFRVVLGLGRHISDLLLQHPELIPKRVVFLHDAIECFHHLRLHLVHAVLKQLLEISLPGSTFAPHYGE